MAAASGPAPIDPRRPRSTTIVTGNTAGANAASDGGGVYTTGIVNLTNASVTANNSDGPGAGIYADGPGNSVTLINSHADSNTSSAGGGAGIWSAGDVTLTNSTASYDEANGSGGGIYSQGGNVTLTGSAVQYDIIASGSFGGGGIYAESDVSLTASSVNSDIATEYGGGIYTSAAPSASPPAASSRTTPRPAATAAASTPRTAPPSLSAA